MSTTALTKTISSTWSVGSGNGGLDTGAVLASTWYHIYLIERTDTGVVDALLSQAPGLSASVTCTNANPAVFTWSGGASLPFQNGCPIVLGGTTAPTGFTLGTTYYVVAANQAAGTFELSATQGGAAINSTSTGTAVTASASPILPANYTKKRRIGSIKTDSSSHILAFSQRGDDFLWSAPAASDINTTLTTTPTFFAITVPIGVNVNARLRGYAANATAAYVIINSPDESAQVPNTIVGNMNSGVSPGATFVTSEWNVRTNSAQQIRAVSTASTSFAAVVFGWSDTRGRFS
jgi:hypothetical protein